MRDAVSIRMMHSCGAYSHHASNNFVMDTADKTMLRNDHLSPGYEVSSHVKGLSISKMHQIVFPQLWRDSGKVLHPSINCEPIVYWKLMLVSIL